LAPDTIEIFAPSRLHFGMFSFGHADVRQFGGVGCMIASPELRLRASAAEKFAAVGPLAGRVAAYAERVGRAWGLDEAPPARIEIVTAPGAHLGLGTGTQLALTTAAALAALAGRPIASVAELASWAGRGERSAVGSHGWRLGGLIIESGRLTREAELSPLVARHPLPEAWRFVLVRPQGLAGLSGAAERRAFAVLPPTAPELTDAMCRIALMGLAPAAIRADFSAFSEALYDYGRLAGRCFAAGRAESFASPRLAALVGKIRDLGGVGVGQSSWGPTLFVAAASQDHAEELRGAIRRAEPDDNVEISITPVSNTGARNITARR